MTVAIATKIRKKGIYKTITTSISGIHSVNLSLLHFNSIMIQLTTLFICALAIAIASSVPIADEPSPKCWKQCTWNGIPSGYACPCATTCCSFCYGCTIYCCTRSDNGARIADTAAQSLGIGKTITAAGNQDVIVKNP